MPIGRFYLLCTLSLLTACGGVRNAADSECLYVSIPPLRKLVQGIVGSDFDVEVLVPPGASPETFEPTARQYIELNNARLIFNIGLIDFETTLLSRIEERGKVVDLCRGIELIEGSCSHGSHAHELEQEQEHEQEYGQEYEHEQKPGLSHAHELPHGIDPHIWSSPKALLRMAENAYDAIRQTWPDSTKYADNYLVLKGKLEALDRRTAERTAAAATDYFIIYHPALTYYARDYGIRQVAIETDGKDPSAKQIARLISDARRDGIRRIFYQSQFPRSAVEVIASDIGAEIIELDPLREDLIANIDEITEQITRP